MRVDIFPLDQIPLYNRDVEKAVGYPGPVLDMRDRMMAAHGLLIATPEYNYSVSGVLKNAIDWASRHPDSPLDHRPVAIMGAGGRFGTLRAQLHLREILSHNHMRVVGDPQVLVPIVGDAFQDGNLVEERFRDQVRRLLIALEGLILERG